MKFVSHVLIVIGLCSVGFLSFKFYPTKDCRYLLAFHESITGLEKGSQVTVRGVPVGYVEGFYLDDLNQRVLVVVVIRQDASCRIDNKIASLKYLGVTGNQAVEFDYTDTAVETETLYGLQVLPTKLSSLSSFYNQLLSGTTMIKNVRQQLENVLDDLHTIVHRVSILLPDDHEAVLLKAKVTVLSEEWTDITHNLQATSAKIKEKGLLRSFFSSIE